MQFDHSTKNPLSYVLLIISFVLAWVETWFLDFKVLPWERKALLKLAAPVHSECSSPRWSASQGGMGYVAQ